MEESSHHIKSDAILRIASGLAVPFPLVAAALLPMPHFVRDTFYDQVCPMWSSGGLTAVCASAGEHHASTVNSMLKCSCVLADISLALASVAGLQQPVPNLLVDMCADCQQPLQVLWQDQHMPTVSRWLPRPLPGGLTLEAT